MSKRKDNCCLRVSHEALSQFNLFKLRLKAQNSSEAQLIILRLAQLALNAGLLEEHPCMTRGGIIPSPSLTNREEKPIGKRPCSSTQEGPT